MDYKTIDNLLKPNHKQLKEMELDLQLYDNDKVDEAYMIKSILSYKMCNVDYIDFMNKYLDMREKKYQKK